MTPQIYSCGLACSAGETVEKAARTILKGKKVFVRASGCIGSDGQEQIVSQFLDYSTERDVLNRLEVLFQRAFEQCMEPIRDRLRSEDQPTLFIALPAWLRNVDALRNRFEEKFYNSTNLAEIDFSYEDDGGGLCCLSRACSQIKSGSIGLALVCGLDTSLTSWLLDLLRIKKGLLGQDNPYGVIPGEAASMILVSNERSLRGIEPLGAVQGIARSQEHQRPLDTNGSVMGRGLADCFLALSTDGSESPDPKLVFANLNGQRHRAEEYGFAVASLATKPESFFDPISLPLSVGDVGAAAGILMIVCGLHSDIAPCENFWVCTGSEVGDRYVARLVLRNR